MSDKKETKEIVRAIPQSLVDHVVANYKKPADLIGENGFRSQNFTKKKDHILFLLTGRRRRIHDLQSFILWAESTK